MVNDQNGIHFPLIAKLSSVCVYIRIEYLLVNDTYSI